MLFHWKTIATSCSKLSLTIVRDAEIKMQDKNNEEKASCKGEANIRGVVGEIISLVLALCGGFTALH